MDKKLYIRLFDFLNNWDHERMDTKILNQVLTSVYQLFMKIYEVFVDDDLMI